jgi:hypothetical protein
MWTFLDKLSERINVVLLILGIALVALFAFHGLAFAHLPITDDVALKILLYLGLLLIAVAIFLIIFKALAGRKSNEISNAKSTTEDLKDEYGIEITTPLNNAEKFSPIEVRGKYKKAPNPGRIYAVERNDQTHQFYVKNDVTFYPDKTWLAEVSIGNGDDKPRTVVIGYFGDDSKILYDYYIRVRDGKGHVGLKTFPADFHRLAEVTVVLKKPLSPVP